MKIAVGVPLHGHQCREVDYISMWNLPYSARENIHCTSQLGVSTRQLIYGRVKRYPRKVQPLLDSEAQGAIHIVRRSLIDSDQLETPCVQLIDGAHLCDITIIVPCNTAP